MSSAYLLGTYVFSYTAYGLTIQSELNLPDLLPAPAAETSDIRILFGPIPDLPEDGKQGCFRADPDEALLYWKVFGTCRVRGGREIVVDPIPGVEEGILRLVITGVALGVLLHQRGVLTLHASAVALEDQAVLFLGAKGMGKSTSAAALHAVGHTLVADDVSALKRDEAGQIRVLPGFPRLNLWPDVIETLGGVPEDLQRLQSHLDKRNYRVDHGFSDVPVPLCAAYVLCDGAELEIQPLPAREAVVELVSNSYALRFLGTVGTSQVHFQECVRTADTLQFFRLSRLRDLNDLHALARAVEEHVKGVVPEGAPC